MADFLKRGLAPLTPEAWAEIEEAAAMRLRPYLSNRHIVDFDGPHGYEYAAVNTGRIEPVKLKAKTPVSAARRSVLPLLEARMPFEVGMAEFDALYRGAKDVDLEPVENAAREIASFEERAVYLGLPEAGIQGIQNTSANTAVNLPLEPEKYSEAVAKALHALRVAGVGGPYALVLGTKACEPLNLLTTTGRLLRQVVEQIIEGSVLWSPVLEGGLLVSARGGDYQLTVGQDMAIGYVGQDDQAIRFEFIESFAFQVIEPAASVPLKL